MLTVEIPSPVDTFTKAFEFINKYREPFAICIKELGANAVVDKFALTTDSLIVPPLEQVYFTNGL